MDRIQVGGRVVDTKGESFQTKFTRPVHVDSESVQDSKVRTTRENTQRETMKPFVDQLSRDMGSETTRSVTNAGIFLRGLPDFIVKTREAGLSQKSVIATTLRLFPELFTVNTSAQGGVATLEKKRLRLSRKG